MVNERYEVPEILYEEPGKGEKPNPIPYIEVPTGKKMPPVLFIFEYRHTGETEPDEKGREQQVIDQIPHKYVDLEVLKEKLPPNLNDIVRVALGMQPLKKAQEAGQKILDKVHAGAEKIKEELLKEAAKKAELADKEEETEEKK